MLKRMLPELLAARSSICLFVFFRHAFSNILRGPSANCGLHARRQAACELRGAAAVLSKDLVKVRRSSRITEVIAGGRPRADLQWEQLASYPGSLTYRSAAFDMYPYPHLHAVDLLIPRA